MKAKKQLFINGDLANDYYEGRIPLRNQLSIKKLTDEYGPLHNGQKIWLFSMGFHNKKLDLLIFQGEIRDLQSDGEAEILVNENDIMRLSESEEFKDYSIEDIIGTEWLNSIKQRYPEWL